jgi:DNA primase
LLAATVETVTRVGPCEAEIKLLDIKDVRETKRKQIIERATELLKEWDAKSLEHSEIEEKIETDIKLAEITTWGPDNLPAGPEVESNPELIIVEGRADVLNLLRIGIKNTIAVEGTQVPKSIIELTKKKTSVTAFLDGDRGGTIILNELLQLAKIDFITRAPEGYEVEELTRKQLIKGIQNKKPISELKSSKDAFVETEEFDIKDKNLKRLLKKLKIKNPSVLVEAITNIKEGQSIGFDKNLNKTFEMPVGEIFEKIKNYKGLTYFIADGILSARLFSVLKNLKIKFIACKNKEDNLKIPEHISVYIF